MSEVLSRYTAVADDFTNRLEGVPHEAWAASSPCSDWTARDIVIHVVNTHWRVLASLDGSDPAEVVSAADDLIAAWLRSTTTVRDALADPLRAGTTVSGMFGEQPFDALVGRLLCTDTLIHTWDLSRATGQGETLNSEAVLKATEFLAPIDDAIRRPGGFGPKIDPPPGSDAQTQLLCFAGRSV